MLGMNTLRAITGGKLPAKEPEAPVETAEVRRMYVFANTVDPRLIKLLKLVEQARTDLLRQSLYRTNAAVCAMHATAVPDPMKQFYQALEFQWECLARHAERVEADQ
jgi:hypothetical protein